MDKIDMEIKELFEEKKRMPAGTEEERNTEKQGNNRWENSNHPGKSRLYKISINSPHTKHTM